MERFRHILGACASLTIAATLEEQLTSITAQRNALAARMIAMLESAAFDHARINEDEARDLIQAADTLIESVP
jgi:hypothetical protein